MSAASPDERLDFGGQRVSTRKLANFILIAPSAGFFGLFAVAGCLIALFAVRRFAARPVVDLSSGVLRAGPRESPFMDIDFAQVEETRGFKERLGLYLRFGATDGAQASVLLRSGPDAAQSAAQRAALLRLLEASSIRMPVDPYDPTGRFSRYNFPTHLTKAQAIEVVEHPPAPKEPLPPPI